jgi:DNA-binding GntR family transcriptional regulator
MSGGLPRDLTDIVTAIENDIIFGRLPPGQRLVEDVLMARFSATRHTIRQALIELERGGIVVRGRNIGAAVRAYTSEEVDQIYQVRELLQRQAAMLIPLPAPPALIGKLEELNATFAREIARGDLRSIHESNDSFHLALFAACGNKYLLGSIADYMALSLPMRARTLADDKQFDDSLHQHRAMISLLREDDNVALARLCVEHVLPSKHSYLHRVAEAPTQRGVDPDYTQSPHRPRRRA